jgi:uncharacterized protein (DUF4415 family)
MNARIRKRDAELRALVQLRDEDIDTSDIPEVTDWGKALVGRFYRPIKEPVTLRLDADVIAWLKSEGPGYQTRVNALLRAAMIRTRRISIPAKAARPSPTGRRKRKRSGSRIAISGSPL